MGLLNEQDMSFDWEAALGIEFAGKVPLGPQVIENCRTQKEKDVTNVMDARFRCAAMIAKWSRIVEAQLVNLITLVGEDEQCSC